MSESARDRYTEMLQQGYDVDVIRQQWRGRPQRGRSPELPQALWLL
jgi:hypothetical protein